MKTANEKTVSAIRALVGPAKKNGASNFKMQATGRKGGFDISVTYNGKKGRVLTKGFKIEGGTTLADIDVLNPVHAIIHKANEK